MDNAHKRGKRILVYTVKRVEDIQRMIQLQVDGVFTVYPDLARQVRSDP